MEMIPSGKQTDTADPGRRYFFRHLLAEMVALCEEIGGRPQLNTADLEKLPDEVVRRMVPMVKSGRSMRFEGNQLLVQRRDTTTFDLVGRLRPEQKQFIKAIDGRRTLDQLARKAAGICGLNPSEVYPVVKSCFCLLARWDICAPVGAHCEAFPDRREQSDTQP